MRMPQPPFGPHHDKRNVWFCGKVKIELRGTCSGIVHYTFRIEMCALLPCTHLNARCMVHNVRACALKIEIGLASITHNLHSLLDFKHSVVIALVFYFWLLTRPTVTLISQKGGKTREIFLYGGVAYQVAVPYFLDGVHVLILKASHESPIPV